ncbi:MAG: hypothetical protein WDN24_05240 [Sphingomonas sp.]
MSTRDDDLIRGRHGAAGTPHAGDAVPTVDAVRARQRGRARVMALLLGAFVVLVFAISIAKMTPGIAQ